MTCNNNKNSNKSLVITKSFFANDQRKLILSPTVNIITNVTVYRKCWEGWEREKEALYENCSNSGICGSLVDQAHYHFYHSLPPLRHLSNRDFSSPVTQNIEPRRRMMILMIMKT